VRFERGRTVDALRMWIRRLGSYVQTTRKIFVQTIEPSKDVSIMEDVVELFSTAFEQVYGLREVDKLLRSRSLTTLKF
jgi:hypothetical protein